MIERIIILLLFLLYLPIIVPLSIYLKLLSDHPIFIKRESIGLNGRKFNYYIFNLQGCSRRIKIILKEEIPYSLFLAFLIVHTIME